MEPEEIGQGTEELGVEDSQGVEETQSTGDVSINPAWNDALGVIPSELHSQVTPYFQQWDKNYQNSIQKVHSQYEPYKSFVDNGVDAEQLEYALGVMQAIESQPQEVLKALQAYIGEDEEEQGLNDTEDGSEETPEWLQHPEYQRLQNMVDTMAQLLVQQRESEVEQEEDAALEAEFSKAKSTHGEFDEDWVLSRMLAHPEKSVEDAVQDYKSWETSILTKARQPGPKVLGPGGSAPSSQLDPSKLDSKGKRSLIEQMLSQAAQQNR